MIVLEIYEFENFRPKSFTHSVHSSAGTEKRFIELASLLKILKRNIEI